MRCLLACIFLMLISSGLYSQNNIKTTYDTVALKVKLGEYKAKLNEAEEYEIKAKNELIKINFFKKEARDFLDSAIVAARKAKYDEKNSKMYLMQFNMLYNTSMTYTKLADSNLHVALVFKDTARLLNLLAETFYLNIAEQYKYTLQFDSTKKPVYVVQLGAGDMDLSYFDKVKDIEIVNPADGIQRFIVGRFKTKEEALAYKKKMIELGYKDAIIRTTDSLKY